MEERLNKLLSAMGVCSRREADRLIESGKVLVDGVPAKMGQKVRMDQTVVCRGKVVGRGEAAAGAGNGKTARRVGSGRADGTAAQDARPASLPRSMKKPRPVLLAVNKPKGVVCTASDKDKAPNIVDMIQYPVRVYYVGRLDKDSEGLVLMTNQGDLVNKIMRSGNAHEKEYQVVVDRPVTAEFLARMEKGVRLKEPDHPALQGAKDRGQALFHRADPGLKPPDPPDVRGLRLPCALFEAGAGDEYLPGRLKERRIPPGGGRRVPGVYEASGTFHQLVLPPAECCQGARSIGWRMRMEDRIERMKELVSLLSKAGKAYYQESREIMSNFEYDRLYDELTALERETGVTLSGSPTKRVGYEVLSELPKETHESPMLSLDKTKSVEDLQAWLGDQKGLLSWKMDGLTIVLTYDGGTLVKAVTRGNGEIGEVITPNARVFANIPLNIAHKGLVVLRGEAVILYSDFRRINEEIEDVDAKYKNPRNLCSGSVRQLNSQITAERNVHFEAFSLVRAEGVDFENSRKRQFEWLKSQGFEVVDYREVTAETLPQAVQEFADAVEGYDIPSDGLVLLFDDIAYGESLGRTAKFPRNSIAFKWQDEIRETKMRYIEWSPSRTGLINPVAVFEPVELEGTTVSRASVHNISILEGLELGEEDRITVYKANMIIPQIADNLTRSGVKHIPEQCPVCGGATEIRQVNDVRSLYCINPDCQAKKIKSFTLLVSRDALNIDGLSEATLEKFIGAGFIHEYADIFHLDRHQEAIVEMEGFGQKSYDNLVASVAKAADTALPRVIYGLGIAGIGLANAKALCRHFGYEFENMRKADEEELVAVDGIGAVLAKAWMEYFSSEANNEAVDHLFAELTIEKEVVEETEQIFAGKTFVITGSLEHFGNRKELQELIESKGGKAAGSVSAKTSYLINNDSLSPSSKNKKAKDLGVPIITEEEFLRMLEPLE